LATALKRGTPLSRVNIGPIIRQISEMVQDRTKKLLLLTHKKSQRAFHWYQNSEIGDLEWRNGGYFALFNRIR